MRFFFYGTLWGGSGSAVARAVHARLLPGVTGTVEGTLYAIPDPQGWYPALVPFAEGGGEGVVHGFVHEAAPGFAKADLAALDAYEGEEYRRRELAVSLADGSAMVAQVYVWAGALPAGAEPIAEGDFAAFLHQRGLKACGEGD